EDRTRLASAAVAADAEPRCETRRIDARRAGWQAAAPAPGTGAWRSGPGGDRRPAAGCRWCGSARLPGRVPGRCLPGEPTAGGRPGHRPGSGERGPLLPAPGLSHRPRWRPAAGPHRIRPEPGLIRPGGLRATGSAGSAPPSSPPGGHERPRERHGRAQQDAAAEAETEPTGGQVDQHDQHQRDDHLPGPQPPQPPVPADPGALGFSHDAQPTLRRRRRTIPTPIATAATTTTSTSSGSSSASTPSDTENTSSTVEATGAPTPAVDRFTP